MKTMVLNKILELHNNDASLVKEIDINRFNINKDLEENIINKYR